MRAREIAVGAVPLLASRVTYVGELGWELYAPAEYGLALYDALTDGRRRRTACAAAATARSSRCGWRRATAPGAPTSRPRRRPSRPASASPCGSTRPRRSSARRRCAPSARPAGRRERLACLVLDDPRSVCLGSEPVRIAGELCGRVTSGGYGSRVRRSIALAYVPAAHAAAGTRAEVEVFGEWVPAEVVEGALYDPAGERIRA